MRLSITGSSLATANSSQPGINQTPKQHNNGRLELILPILCVMWLRASHATKSADRLTLHLGCLESGIKHPNIQCPILNIHDPYTGFKCQGFLVNTFGPLAITSIYYNLQKYTCHTQCCVGQLVHWVAENSSKRVISCFAVQPCYIAAHNPNKYYQIAPTFYCAACIVVYRASKLGTDYIDIHSNSEIILTAIIQIEWYLYQLNPINFGVIQCSHRLSIFI